MIKKVLSVKGSQITKFTLKTHALEPQINPCFGYLEQHGIHRNKEIHAKGKLSYKKIHAPVQGTNNLETWELSKTA